MQDLYGSWYRRYSNFILNEHSLHLCQCMQYFCIPMNLLSETSIIFNNSQKNLLRTHHGNTIRHYLPS
jgi:hypothetical protein